jgi:hypothetical protein
VVFFLGQFAKIGLTVALLAAIHKWLGPLQWLPLLLGLIVALKAPLFALLYVRSQPEGADEAGGGEIGSMQADLGSTKGTTATSSTGTGSTGAARSVGNGTKGTPPGGNTTGSRRKSRRATISAN